LGFRRADAVEQLGAGDEGHAQACRGQQYAAIAGIALHVMAAALDRSYCDRVGDQIGLHTRLDDKQPTEFPEYRHG
jgi:hypothetical protein